jgi:peptide/nickel transport system permease protein
MESYSEAKDWNNIVNNLQRLLKDPIGLTGVVLVLIMVLSAVFAPLIITHNPNALNISEKLASPSLHHLFGTDQLGRDTFSRVVIGSRIALRVVMISITLSLIGGVILGLLAGYGPLWLDNFLLFFFDTIYSFPTIMLALAIVTVVGPSLNTVILIIVITSIPVYGRIVRTQTLAIRNKDFIQAEKAMDAGMFRILGIHIMPNIIGPLLILASMDIPVVITMEAGLSFLGLGVRPPTASWGSILNDGYAFIRDTPWLVVSGSIPLILATLGFTLLGESLRDIFDPRLRKEI